MLFNVLLLYEAVQHESGCQSVRGECCARWQTKQTCSVLPDLFLCCWVQHSLSPATNRATRKQQQVPLTGPAVDAASLPHTHLLCLHSQITAVKHTPARTDNKRREKLKRKSLKLTKTCCPWVQYYSSQTRSKLQNFKYPFPLNSHDKKAATVNMGDKTCFLKKIKQTDFLQL